MHLRLAESFITECKICRADSIPANMANCVSIAANPSVNHEVKRVKRVKEVRGSLICHPPVSCFVATYL